MRCGPCGVLLDEPPPLEFDSAADVETDTAPEADEAEREEENAEMDDCEDVVEMSVEEVEDADSVEPRDDELVMEEAEPSSDDAGVLNNARSLLRRDASSTAP